MKRNMGQFDRVIRVCIAITILFFYYSGWIGGSLKIAALVVAGLLFLTSIFGICPLYQFFGIDTKSIKRKSSMDTRK